MAVIGVLSAVCFINSLITTVLGGKCPSDPVDLTATLIRQNLTTPNYPYSYTNNEQCRWRLTVTKSYEVVHLQIMDSHVQDSTTCGNDFGEIKDGANLWDRSMKTWCGLDGGGMVGKVFISSGASMLVTFRSNKDVAYRGFRLEYWSAPKAETNYLAPRYSIVNYILFGIFGVIVVSIIVTCVIIYLLRKRNIAFRNKMAAVAGVAKEMTQPNATAKPTSRKSSAKTRLSVSAGKDQGIGLTPVGTTPSTS